MTNPMSAEEIVSKWCKEPPYDFGTVTATEVQMYEMEKQAVRQALASHLAYVMGKMPEEDILWCGAGSCDGYSDAIRKAKTILQAEKDSLVGKDNESPL